MPVEWERPKGHQETANYGHDWSPDLGTDTILSSTWTAVEAAGTSKLDETHTDKIAMVVISGGVPDQPALWRNDTVTVGGNTLIEYFRLKVIDKAQTTPGDPELSQLRADLADLQRARVKLLSGEAVKEVARNGRRLVRFQPSVADIDNAIARLEREIANLTATTAGTRRRRALSLSF